MKTALEHLQYASELAAMAYDSAILATSGDSERAHILAEAAKARSSAATANIVVAAAILAHDQATKEGLI